MDIVASPGKHALAPRALKDNVDYRAELIRWVCAEGEPEDVHRARRDLVWAMCQEDPFFYFDSFAWTYDPRKTGNPSLPFILYDYQRDALSTMLDCLGSRDFLIEKSRDMGASWLCAGLFEWAWHFLPQKTSFLLVSRVEDLVDERGNMKALMVRLDFNLDRQPHWLRPNVHRKHLSLTNLDTGSMINGESTTGEVARGDRRTAILLDEFASVESDYAVLKSTRDATNCRVFNSTPRGAKGAFYDMRCKLEIMKLRLHWTLHPEKAVGLYHGPDGNARSPWYDAECARCVHPMEIAQELDIDYAASDAQFFDDKLIDSLAAKTKDPVFSAFLAHDSDRWELCAMPRARGSRIQSGVGEYRSWVHYDLEARPPSGARYAIGVDVAHGTGATPSVASIGDIMTGEKIAELATSVRRPEDFAGIVIALAKLFNNALIIWEVNGPGAIFTAEALRSKYSHLWQRRATRATNNIFALTNGANHLGWASNKTTKAELLGGYRRALVERQLINYCKMSLDECRGYTFGPGGEISHARSRQRGAHAGDQRENHGDRVVADALLAMAMTDRKVTEAAAREPVAPVVPPEGTFAHRRHLAQRREREQAAW